MHWRGVSQYEYRYVRNVLFLATFSSNYAEFLLQFFSSFFRFES
jgi:hypothetical protein